MGRLSEEFLKLSRDCNNRAMNLKEFLHFSGSRSRALITAVCSLPFVLFIPLPGLSIVFGFLIVLVGYSITLDKPIWMPQRLLKKQISGEVVAKFFTKGASILKSVEKIARPRLQAFCHHSFLQRFNGILILLCGALLMLPLPPGTNFTPGLAGLCISVGILEEDGLFVIFGYIAFLANIVLFVLLPIIGIKALMAK